MITSIIEIVIDLAALMSGIAGVAFIVYFLALVWREHRDEVSYLEDHRAVWLALHAKVEPERSETAEGVAASSSSRASRPVLRSL